jgi:hypothetical protein
MANDNDKDLLKEQADALEARLAAQEQSLETEESKLEAASVGAAAVAEVERHKDDSASLSQDITQKYLGLGRQLLSDAGAGRLDQDVRNRVSRILGRDPGDVRIHTGEKAAAAADALGARAFAVGESDVFFGRGQFNPSASEGFGVLVHELAHTTDNQVGAAFARSGGSHAYSEAESHAEAAEQFAVQEAESRSKTTGMDGGDPEPEEEDLDLDELQKAVLRVLKRHDAQTADRTGLSGKHPDAC